LVAVLAERFGVVNKPDWTPLSGLTAWATGGATTQPAAPARVAASAIRAMDLMIIVQFSSFTISTSS
jgi:hypothetical protein